MSIINNLNTLFFEHHKYIKITKFYGEEIMRRTNDLIKKIKDNEYYKHSNNTFWSNKRRQYILYQNGIISDTEENKLILERHFEIMKNMFYDGLKIDEIVNYCNHIGKTNNMCLERISYIEVNPGCPEQPVHIDPFPPNEKQNIFYIGIALEDTPSEMGGIIVYDYSKIKKPNDLKKLSQKELLLEKKLLVLNKGDINIHNQLTVHHGGANNSKRVRRFIFIVCTLKNDMYASKALIKENKINNKIFKSIDIYFKRPYKINKAINEHGFIILKDYLNKTFEKKLNFYEKKMTSSKYSNIFDWKGSNGNNPYIRNINRTSHELFSDYYYDLFNNNQDKINIEGHYLYDNNKRHINKIDENIKKSYIELMSWCYKYTMDIFKDLFNYLLKNYADYKILKLVSVKIHKLFKNCKEQEIHQDLSYEMDKNRGRDSINLIITVPMNNIKKELNTIFYDKKILNGYKNSIKILKENLDVYEKIFKPARFQTDANIGDIQIHNVTCYHHGPANNSSIIRKFLFIEVELIKD